MKQVQYHSTITLSALYMPWLRIADKQIKSCKHNELVEHFQFRKEQTYFITQPCKYKLR